MSNEPDPTTAVPVQTNGYGRANILEGLTEEQKAKRSRLLAETKRYLLKRKDVEVETDSRTAQEIEIAAVEEVANSDGWAVDFDKEESILVVRRGQAMFKAALAHNSSSMEEGFFVRNCSSFAELEKAIEQGFEFKRADADLSTDKHYSNIDSNYSHVLDLAVASEWSIQGDNEDPDKLTLSKGIWTISVRLLEDGGVSANIGRKFSNLIEVIDEINNYKEKPDVVID